MLMTVMFRSTDESKKIAMIGATKIKSASVFCGSAYVLYVTNHLGLLSLVVPLWENQ